MSEAYQSRQEQWERRWSNPSFSPAWKISEIPQDIQEAVNNGWFLPESSVLDIGCGSGEIAAWLAKQNFKVLGIDFSLSAIKQAKSEYPEVPGKLEFQTVDICRQPSPLPRFNAAIDRGCFHVIPKSLALDYVKNIASWLMPEARFLLLFKVVKMHNLEDIDSKNNLYGDAIHYIQKTFGLEFDILRIEKTVMQNFQGKGGVIPGVAAYMLRKKVNLPREKVTRNVPKDRDKEMPEVKMGGQPALNLLIWAGSDVANSLLSFQEGGAKLNLGIRDLVKEKYAGKFELKTLEKPWTSSEGVLQALQKEGNAQNLLEETIDIVVFSIQSALTESGDKVLSVERYYENLVRIVRLIKEQMGAYIIFFNCCSLDPEERMHNYHNLTDSLSLRIQKLNLALIKLSMLEGISIIDVDYILAELGGDHHVLQALDYSPAAWEAISLEFLRVIEDVGFFELRPLLVQIGKIKS
ncbi:class I SAM-dependent methyltransferase [Laspinema olomoucense]|uniref:class I SAM-dependent methyltransferase n=1 Tax=Laspinema olomoucense TaxID=3231600 RepID=UPI0021BAFCF4|nr:class I SAM-dependent methyltransferase [Laspinema sp. D3a]MCT7989006.1 class I SAM-dependent methyltransferase [Laspinema sp. D3a]